MAFARVVIDLSLDREFDYRIPPALAGRVAVGSRVLVPFGAGGRTRLAYVVGLTDTAQVTETKDVLALQGDGELITPSLIRLSRWMADYYGCARERAVRAMLPAAVRSGLVRHRAEPVASLAAGLETAAVLPDLAKRAPKQAAVVQALVRRGPLSVAALAREADVSPAIVRAVAAKGLVRIEDRVVERDPFADDVVLPTEPHDLNEHQRQAVDQINGAMAAGRPQVILLHGVTGSGKTEVYLQSIHRCLALGREAVVLVPEIALTPQTTERFRSRFGTDVCVLHSALSDGERFDEWQRARDGRARIVVGARSALFAPFRRLGLIVVDEEHESTYKQDEAPRYNARDVAVVRGKMENAVVVLGSATPALESYHNCRIGKYQLAELPVRVDDARLPHMEVVDMRAEAMLRGGVVGVFSRRLEELVRERLADGSQTILFLNRRGYATQMLCMVCGFVASCPDCSVTYTYHREAQQLVCHICGRVMAAPPDCPQCHDPNIRYSGLGTERVEAITRRLFPQATVARMDSDTMTRKDAYRKTLQAFRAGRIHILIGTQMIAKGLDFPNVTLVGIVAADSALHLPDFRAGERTFQLLTQVSGRAGRGEKPGHVVVQTFTPFHPALRWALVHDYRGFYEEEMEARQQLGFPPETHMAVVHFRGEDENLTAQAAEAFTEALRGHLGSDTTVAGPMPAPIARARRLFRYQLTLRTARITRLSALLRRLVVEDRRAVPKGVEAYLDVDPLSLL